MYAHTFAVMRFHRSKNDNSLLHNHNNTMLQAWNRDVTQYSKIEYTKVLSGTKALWTKAPCVTNN